MNSKEFEQLLRSAVAGEKEAVAILLEQYMPLIDKYSYHGESMDEDLKQYLLIHIMENIKKFTI